MPKTNVDVVSFKDSPGRFANVLRWMYNGVSLLLGKKCQLADNRNTYIIGTGKYNGADTAKWADAAREKLPYFSYGSSFAPLKNGATTDFLWGCMIRAGQMLLACAFMRFHNGGGASFDADAAREFRRRTEVLFLDVPEAPFGIHAVTREGERHGVACGGWFGPTSIAHTLGALAASHLAAGGDGPVVIACPAREVDVEEVTGLLRQSRQVLLLIPVMLGITAVSAAYAKLMKRCFKMESFMGILGGCCDSAFFFFGRQGDHLFYMDPHFLQRAFTQPKEPGVSTCPRRSMRVTDCNTSMTLGFYIFSLESFASFEKDMARLNADLVFPLIGLTHGQQAVAPLVVGDSGGFVVLSTS